MTGKSARDRVIRARSLSSKDDARRLYAEWAGDYDRDVAEELRFIGGDRIAALLSRHLDNRSAEIIDLGCGTGLVGEALRQQGFTAIAGLDFSPEMLSIAEHKGVYSKTIAADLLAPLDIADASFDAAISAGTFTTGHVDASALPEIGRILRPGAILACVVADAFWQAGGFEAVFDKPAFGVLHRSTEAIVQDGEPEGHYLVVRVNCESPSVAMI